MTVHTYHPSPVGPLLLVVLFLLAEVLVPH